MATRQTYLVEVWENGADYEAGQAGTFVRVRATSPQTAEMLASRRYEVVDCQATK